MASGARKPRLAAFTKNRTNPAYVGARLGADRVAARLGCSLTHHVPQKPDDVDEQRALLETALAARPDAILLAPTHATALNDILGRAVARGIPLLCFVSRPEGTPLTCYVGSDDRALARGIAEHLFDHLGPAGGDVVTIEGHVNAMTTAPRAAGFRDAAAARGNIHITASRVGDYQREPGRAAMAELLAAEPGIDGVLAANDFMALGALEAMRAAGRRLPIVGINATPEGVAAIRQGDLLASSSFDAMKMACLAVEAAARVLDGEHVPAEIMLPVEVVDAGNCAAWDLPYAERPLPDWERYAAR
jgi:ribose transport system substrate-binding protein